VLIEHCDVSTGDDAICLKAGRGPDAWKDGRPLENVLIRHCRIGFGHGGITIGSEMSAGVRNVHVHDCEIDGVDRGIRIKSKPDRGGYVENIRIERVRMQRVIHAIDVNLLYDGNKEETLDIKTLRDVPRFEDIILRDIHCASAQNAITLQGLPGYPIKRVTLEDITITALHGKICEHVEQLTESQVVIHPLDNPVSLGADAHRPAIESARKVAVRIEGPDIPFPPEKRPMAGRKVAAITHSDETPPLQLHWEETDGASTAACLRFTVAVDQRCFHRVNVVNAATQQSLGVCQVPYGCPGQVFEFPLTAAQTEAALRDGLWLSLTEQQEPLWIVTPGPNAPNAVLPQLFLESGQATEEDFLHLFCSDASRV
jgi:hypothetical protein